MSEHERSRAPILAFLVAIAAALIPAGEFSAVATGRKPRHRHYLSSGMVIASRRFGRYVRAS